MEQPISGELREVDSSLDLPNLVSSITRKDIKVRIAQTKTNTAAGLDGLTKRHIKVSRSQDILTLLHIHYSLWEMAYGMERKSNSTPTKAGKRPKCGKLQASHNFLNSELGILGGLATGN
jgi:hypothetical protein